MRNRGTYKIIVKPYTGCEQTLDFNNETEAGRKPTDPAWDRLLETKDPRYLSEWDNTKEKWVRGIELKKETLPLNKVGYFAVK
jgi:hypothetical protein